MTQPVISLEMIYQDESFINRIRHVANHGFDAVEFATWFDKDLDAIETCVERHGVSIKAMSAIQERGMPQNFERAMTDRSMRETVIMDIKRSIEIADRFDCPNLIVLVGPNTGSAPEEMFNNIVSCLREVAPIAESADVSLVIEPLNTLLDHPGFFIEHSQTGYDIIDEVDSPAVKLLFDIYHQQITEGNIITNMTSNLGRIGHIHVADVPGRYEPGTGELHYANILSTIEEAGYNGTIGFEFTPKRSEQQALISIRQLMVDN